MEMINPFRRISRRGVLSTLAACAALGTTLPAAAEELQQDDGKTASRDNDSATVLPVSFKTTESPVSLIAGFYYPSEFCPEPRLGANLDVPDVSLLYTPGVSPFSVTEHHAPFAASAVQLEQTDNFLDRLAELEKLEILPLLRTTSASVYFGINADGRLGMHVNSNK